MKLFSLNLTNYNKFQKFSFVWNDLKSVYIFVVNILPVEEYLNNLGTVIEKSNWTDYKNVPIRIYLN